MFLAWLTCRQCISRFLCGVDEILQDSKQKSKLYTFLSEGTVKDGLILSQENNIYRLVGH
jgi:hypothetical protein